MLASYWGSLGARRVDRRRMLGITSGAAAAAFLAACGGSNSGRATSGDKSGLLATPVDTSKQAKRGGELKRNATSDPASLDATGGGATVVGYFEFTYSRLFGYKAGVLEPSKNEFEPDVAESWEWSPDHLQLTAKLRNDVKFHNLAPVNGRTLDVDDVLYSWKRVSTTGVYRSVLSNAVNPDAVIQSVTSPDSRTVVFKFTEPLVYIQNYLAQRQYLPLMPKEADSLAALDLRQNILGTGPFFLSEYRPSLGLTFKRHAGYYNKDKPFVDQIDYPIISEYAAGLAQFRSGNIHAYAVKQEDVLQTKTDMPAVNMYDAGYAVDTRRVMLGWQTPFLRDKRVRQALSMTIARDDWIDAAYNTPVFQKAGLNVSRRWNTALAASDAVTGWWLDPQGKDFGPNAKYFQHNGDEAKKLLAAAAGSGAIPEIPSNYFTTGQNGLDYTKLIELFESMAGEAGFRFKKNIIDYTDFLQNYRDASGKYTGLAYRLGPPAGSSDPVDLLSYEYSKKGGVGFIGFDVDGKGDFSGDPYVEGQLAKARVDFDTEKRRAIVFDLQRYLAEQQYTIRWPGGATAFELAWPALKNYRVFQPGDSLPALVANTTWWLDDTQAPFKS